MQEVLLSDSTLAAFMQRDNERRMSGQTEAAVISSNNEILHNTGPLRSELTIAALQRRFASLEQRIVDLEQLVGEQRRKDLVEAASVAPREEMRGREELLLTSRIPLTPNLDAPHLVDEQAQFAAAKIEDARVEAAGSAGEQRLNRNDPEIVRLDAGDRLERDRIDVRPYEADDVERAHKKAHRFVSLVFTALIAGTIGFGAAINVVPIEKASQFRALAKHGFASIFEGQSATSLQ